jgi:hypothetical protein
MNDRIPRTEPDHVLADVKAKPSGWPPASLDPGSGRGPQATSGTPATRTTKSGLYGFRGLPTSACHDHQGQCPRQSFPPEGHLIPPARMPDLSRSDQTEPWNVRLVVGVKPGDWRRQ